VKIAETFTVSRPPGEVFEFMIDPDNLAKWQTIKTHATPLDDGPPGKGYRIREGSRMGPRKWEQVVEFTEFQPARLLEVTVVEGPPSRGRWAMRPDGSGTRVEFEAELEAPAFLRPVMKRLASRQFRGYHRNLRRELESHN
jgi:uncharacterized protein YndB with AHSA1/START domain